MAGTSPRRWAPAAPTTVTPPSVAPTAAERRDAIWRERLDRFMPAALRSHGEEFDRTTSARTVKTWIADLAAACFTVVVAGAIWVGGKDHGKAPSELMTILDIVFTVVSVALLFWRRRYPFRIGIAIGAISCIAPATGLAALIALYAVAAYSRPAVGVVGIVYGLITVPVALAIWPSSSNGTTIGNLSFGALATLGVGAWGLFAGARRELMATLRERATRAESEQQLRVDQARQAERTRIAREMHDVLAHRMSLLSVHAGALEYRPDAPPEEVARAAGVIRATAHEALEELRSVIGVLRVGDSLAAGSDAATGDGAARATGADAPEPPQPTLSAVPHLVEEWQGAGMRIDLDCEGLELADVPPSIGRTAYRIVQEALTNAGKHAPMTKVSVHVAGRRGGSLRISVTNPLTIGTDAATAAATTIPGTGLGLVGVRERTELAGGAFAAGVDQDLGRFVLEARLPWPK